MKNLDSSFRGFQNINDAPDPITNTDPVELGNTQTVETSSIDVDNETSTIKDESNQQSNEVN